MTQEDKNLLLKDLCARSPYGVIADCVGERIKINYVNPHSGMVYISNYTTATKWESIEVIKPYLRPMSSISELITAKEWSSLGGIDLIDWYNANYIDYRGLIEKDLAIEVTEENNPYKSNL